MAEDQKKRFSEELTKERLRRKLTKKSSSQTDEEDDLLSGQSVLKLDEYFPREIPLGLCGDKFRCNDPHDGIFTLILRDEKYKCIKYCP